MMHRAVYRAEAARPRRRLRRMKRTPNHRSSTVGADADEQVSLSDVARPPFAE